MEGGSQAAFPAFKLSATDGRGRSDGRTDGRRGGGGGDNQSREPICMPQKTLSLLQRAEEGEWSGPFRPQINALDFRRRTMIWPDMARRDISSRLQASTFDA